MNPRKILLIEDDQQDATLITNLLKEKGYIVTHVSGGKEGIKKAKRERYDLIILDLLLPDSKGEAVCVSLKRGIRCKKIPIIVLSVKDEIEDIEDVLRLGADDYIIKPPRPQYLLKKIEERLSSTSIRA